MSLQLTPDLEHELRALATLSNTTADELAQDALENFVAHRRELNASVKRGDDDFAAGRVVSHQEVVARMERLLHSKTA